MNVPTKFLDQRGYSMPTKTEIAEAVERKRSTQSKMILLPEDCREVDAERLDAEAQAEFPLHAIIALM